MEDETRECPICDGHVDPFAFREHLKACRRIAIGRWRGNHQGPRGSNFNHFFNDNYCSMTHYLPSKVHVEIIREQPPVDFECPICFKNTLTHVKRTNCDHMFCEPCLTRWLNISAYCPQCRGPQ